MAAPEVDPMQGVWRWTWREAKRRRGEFWLAGAVFTVVTLAAGIWLESQLLSQPTPGQKFVAGLEAAGLGMGAVVLLSLVFALILAPFQQRNALRRTVQTALDEVDPHCLELEGFEISGWAGVNPEQLLPDEMLVSPVFRNRLLAPLEYQVESFSAKIEPDTMLAGRSDEVFTIPPQQSRVFRIQGGRFRVHLHDPHQIEIEYAMVYWRPGIVKRFRRTHKAVVDHRPIADDPNRWLAPPPWTDVNVTATEIQGLLVEPSG
jgi:hypothetical protein